MPARRYASPPLGFRTREPKREEKRTPLPQEGGRGEANYTINRSTPHKSKRFFAEGTAAPKYVHETEIAGNRGPSGGANTKKKARSTIPGVQFTKSPAKPKNKRPPQI